MTQTNAGGNTPPSVAQRATRKVDIDLGAPMLIGIFGPEDGLSAMVRLPGGRIRKVRRGERLMGRRVTGIDADGVSWTGSGTSNRLTLP